MTDQKKCFIIMPITPPEDRIKYYNNDREHFIHVLECLFKPALIDAEFDPVSPISQGSGIIHADIISNIESSDLVLCDMSILSPNVFFELGIRTALNKPICLVKDSYADQVPFDTSIINYYTYSSHLFTWDIDKDRKNLKKHILESFNGSGNSNALWKYFSLTSIASSQGEFGEKSDKLDYLIMQISAIKRQLDEKQKVMSIKQEDIGNAVMSTEIANIALDTQRFNKEIQRDALDTLSKIENSSEEISTKVAKKLTKDPTWLEKFTDESGISYLGSIFGTRINHFYHEKKALAEKAIDVLEEEMLRDEYMKYCLLIDSGTTMFNVFCEISERILKERKSTIGNDKFDIWNKRVLIITNNLPGIQYLMKYCKDGSDEYADLLLKCLLLPGEPLPVYAAVTGSETNDSLAENYIRKTIREKLNVKSDERYKIISFIASNYMVRHPSERSDIGDSYCPVARGEGHFALKTRFAELSDEIYLISPLTKFSFAKCEELNKLNGFYIDEKKCPTEAKESPEKAMYHEIELITDDYRKKSTFFLTDRQKTDVFWNFAQSLRHELETSYGSEKVIITPNFRLESWISVDRNNDNYRDQEIKKEIPHESLRDAYQMMKKDGHFIWDMSWITNPR